MSDSQPHLQVSAGRQPAAVVLVLHGGREASTDPVTATQLPVLRLIPFATRIARRGKGRVAVARLRFRVRGWNATRDRQPDPVRDAEWALQRLADRFPGLPIGLVGHSMGGRTALRVGGNENVRAVVGLAPWLPLGEPVRQLIDRQVLLVHGTADRMTDPRGTAAFADRLEQAGGAVSLVRINGGKHAMLGRPGLWHELAAQFVLSAVLPGFEPSDRHDAPNFIHQAMSPPARLTY